MIAGFRLCTCGSMASEWLPAVPPAPRNETSRTKLVRDKIPEIMLAAGQLADVHTAEPYEFQVRLRQKLTEEVHEFLMSQNPEELADILEVLYALAGCLGLDAAKLEALRREKAERRGAFAERIVWHGPRSAASTSIA
jgi:predicted house-cleaning noncanonical NTP pyrophosphatase (MazG superfamily)